MRFQSVALPAEGSESSALHAVLFFNLLGTPSNGYGGQAGTITLCFGTHYYFWLNFPLSFISTTSERPTQQNHFAPECISQRHVEHNGAARCIH